MEMLDYFMNKMPEIVTALVALHGAALVIVNMTPTPADDAALAKMYTVIEWLAGIFTAKAKQ